MSWRVATLSDVAEVRLGRQRAPKNHRGDSMRPYVRAANVTWAGLNLDDVKTMNFTDRELETYRLQPGDLLLSEASGSAGEVGKPALWQGEIADCAFQNTVIRVRPREHEPKFLLHYFRYQALAGRFVEHSRGVGIHHLGRSRLAAWPIPVPPIAEQRRIVDLVEDHLSRLDAASALLRASLRRANAMAVSSLAAQVTSGSGHWPVSTVGQQAQVIQYGSGAKCGASNKESDIPVLRMGNVKDGALVWGNLKYLPCDHGDFPKLLLQPGDLLFNRTNSAEHVGKSAVFDLDRTASFASYLIRVRFGPQVSPVWASMVINSPMGREYVASVVSQQVGQANVNGTKLKAFPLPLPPWDEQVRRATEHAAVVEAREQLRRSVATAVTRAAGLRRSLLDAAFSGRLTGSLQVQDQQWKVVG